MRCACLARYNAPGDFAEAYVIALEIGYHVQNILGVLPRVEDLKRGASEGEVDRLSAQLALQADCFAGVWAHDEEKRGFLDVGDIDEAVNAAAQLAEDVVARRGQSDVLAITRGTSEQRVRWFRRGYNGGGLSDCDTFGPGGI
jgi:predicted metalloprotease